MNENEKVLITGGSGKIGKYLTSLLLTEGYQVVHLSRQQSKFGKVRVFRWDPDKKVIDPLIFEGIDYIIHLAGADIGKKRWTRKRKDEIVRSRVDSALFLFKTVSENNIPLKAFISASGTGYYGSVTSERIFTEDDLPSYGFLADTCRKWEEAACYFLKLGTRTVRIRTALVLHPDSYILSKLHGPVKKGILPRLGSGRQYMPWIHITDLCNIYLKALRDDNMAGAYNAVSPGHVTYLEFIESFAQAMHKKAFCLPVPSVILRTGFGKMADIVLKGSRVSPGKIQKAGYQFIFDNLPDALADIIKF